MCPALAIWDHLILRLRAEQGQGLPEYALIFSFISLIAVGALSLLGANISSVLSQLARSL